MARLIYDGPIPARPRDYYALTAATYARSFVYIISEADETVHYVGMSFLPGRRFDKHKRKAWWPQEPQATILQVDGKDPRDAQLKAMSLESRLIRTLAPLYNIAGVAN